MGAWLRNSTHQVFLKGAGLLWILSLIGFLPSPWSVPLSALFVILATLIAYLLWGFPLSVPSEDQAYQVLLRQFKSLPTMHNGTVIIRTSGEEGRELYATWCPRDEMEEMRRFGTRDSSIILHIASKGEYVKMVAGDYTINGRLVQVALFPSLPEGDYIFWTPRVSERKVKRDYFSYTTVLAGQVTEIDWRYQ